MKLPRSPTAIVILSVVVVLLTYAVYLISSIPGTAGGPIPSGFSVGGTSFTFTYVATTEQERETGLMNTKVTNSTTMLFAFPSLGRWQFYMYDTNTSLDMLWVNATGDSGRVVYLVTGAEPCHTSADSCPRYTPNADANYVIEAKAGFASEHGVSVGTAISFEEFQPEP